MNQIERGLLSLVLFIRSVCALRTGEEGSKAIAKWTDIEGATTPIQFIFLLYLYA